MNFKRDTLYPRVSDLHAEKYSKIVLKYKAGFVKGHAIDIQLLTTPQSSFLVYHKFWYRFFALKLSQVFVNMQIEETNIKAFQRFNGSIVHSAKYD